MNTKFLSDKAISIIDQYKNFKLGNAVCSIPYYNNRHSGGRAKLRVENGKGSPKEIFEEIEQIIMKEKISIKDITSEELKKILVLHNIGIDCSGYAYYILNAESISLGKGSLDKHLSFPFSKGIIGKIRSMMRPIENTNVETFASKENSHPIEIKDARVGDIITMQRNSGVGERNHILVIYQVEYQNFIPIKLHYTHSIAWPSHGEYGHGINGGIIEIIDTNKSLVEQKWIESDKTGKDNYTYMSAKNSTTELLRLNFLK
jgi:hypothetical protein